MYEGRYISDWMSYKTSSTLALIFALPADGRARTVLHPRHLTLVEAFPKMVCVSLHFEHFTLMNFPFCSM